MATGTEKGGIPIVYPHQKVQSGGRELGMDGGHWGNITV